MFERNYNRDVLKTVDDLGVMIKELDQVDSERNLVPYSTDDKLNNLKIALAQLIQNSSNLGTEDSEREAEKIVEGIVIELKKIGNRKKICSMFNVLAVNLDAISTGTISGVIAALVISGNLVLPTVATNPLLGIPICIWIILRLGLACYCSE